MDKTEAIIVIKFGDSEIDFDVILEFWIIIDCVEQSFGECSDDWLFIVVDNVLEKLVYEFYFEVGQVEACIVVWVKLISDIEYNFIFFSLCSWMNELVNKPIS